MNFVWFGNISRLFHWEDGFPRSNDFYLPSLRVGKGGGEGRHPLVLYNVYIRVEMGEGVQGDGSSVYLYSANPIERFSDEIFDG